MSGLWNSGIAAEQEVLMCAVIILIMILQRYLHGLVPRGPWQFDPRLPFWR